MPHRSAHAEIVEFLARYGRALADGDPDAIAASYDHPSAVVGEDATDVVADADAIRTLFAGSFEQYARLGVVAAVAGVEHTRSAGTGSGRLWTVDVRWSYRDANDFERATESYLYVLRDSGEAFTIAAVVPRPPDRS